MELLEFFYDGDAAHKAKDLLQKSSIKAEVIDTYMAQGGRAPVGAGWRLLVEEGSLEDARKLLAENIKEIYYSKPREAKPIVPKWLAAIIAGVVIGLVIYRFIISMKY